MIYRAPLREDERVITCNRPHPVKLLGPLLLLLLAIFTASMFQVLASGGSGAWNVAAVIVLIAAGAHAAVKGWRWVVGGFALTTERVVVFRSWRGRSAGARPLALPLENIRGAVASRGGAWGSVLLHYGADRHVLTFQREPAHFVELLEEQREARLRRLSAGWSRAADSGPYR